MAFRPFDPFAIVEATTTGGQLLGGLVKRVDEEENERDKVPFM